MYLFSYLTTLQGTPDDTAALAAELATTVDSLIEPEVSCWSWTFGFPAGTYSISATYESRAQLAEVMAQLQGNDRLDEVSRRGQALIAGPAEQMFLSLIHPAEPENRPTPVGTVVTLTTAAATPGHFGDVVGFGVEISQMVTGITGAPVGFFSHAYGTWGQFSWLSPSADLAAADTATDAIWSNAEYLAAIDAAGDLFLPGSGMQALGARIA